MNVAILLPSLENTAPIKVAQLIVEQLHTKVNFTVYYFNNKVDLVFKCKTHQIKFNTSAAFLNNYDLVHAHMLRPDLYLWLHRKTIKTKTISTVHQYIFDNLYFSYNFFIAKLFTPFWHKLLKNINYLVCINKHMSQLYAAKLKHQNTFYIYNGIVQSDAILNNAELAYINNLKKDKTLLISLAMLTKRKGIDMVIEALVENPNYHYLVFGSGKELNNLKLLASKLGVEDQISFMGFKTNAHAYLNVADVMVVPSRSEGFGLVLAEAASAKIPIVASNVEAFKEMFSDNEVSFFDLENPETIGSAINNALINKQTLAENAFVKYTQNYTAKTMGNAYFSLYYYIINDTNG